MSIRGCLFRAVRHGDVRVVTAMLAARANPNARRNRQTALHVAAENDHDAIINILIDAGANLEARNESGETALHKATEGAELAALRLLIEAKADINAQENNGNTALHEAAEPAGVSPTSGSTHHTRSPRRWWSSRLTYSAGSRRRVVRSSRSTHLTGTNSRSRSSTTRGSEKSRL